MRRIILFLLVAILAIAVLPQSASVQAQHRNNLLYCTFPDGPYAEQNIFVRYEVSTQRVLLVSYTTGDVIQELESGVDTQQFDVRGWSDDCRYMVASLGAWGQQQTAAWDVKENRRVGTIQTIAQSYTGLAWSPDNIYVLIESVTGGYLWHLPSNAQHLLTTYSDGYGQNFYHFRGYYSTSASITWDFSRGQLLIINRGPASNGVTAYDLASGQQVGFFHIGDAPTPIRYQFLENGNKILVDSDTGVNSLIGRALWDRNSLSGFLVEGIYSFSSREIFYSPDSRYLVMGLDKTVRVWDLANAGPGLQTPVIDWHNSWFETARFIDATTLDIVQLHQFAFPQGGFTLYRYDVSSGTLLFEYRQEDRYKCYPSLREPEDDDALLDWLCDVTFH